MKLFTLLILSAGQLGLQVLAQPPPQNPAKPASPPERSADPQVIWAYNTQLLESRAELWQKNAGKTNNSSERDLYIKLAENYRQMKAQMEKQMLAEKNGHPYHYEMLYATQTHNRVLREKARNFQGGNMPEELQIVRPPPPAADQTPEPEPLKKSHTTPSGFDVKLRLED